MTTISSRCILKEHLSALNLSPRIGVKIFAMKRRDFLQKWGLSSLKIKLGFLEGEFAPQDPDRAAAWELSSISPRETATKKPRSIACTPSSAYPRNPAASGLGLRRIRQAFHSGAQSDYPALHGEMAPAFPCGRIRGFWALQRVPGRIVQPSTLAPRLHPRPRRHGSS